MLLFNALLLMAINASAAVLPRVGRSQCPPGEPGPANSIWNVTSFSASHIPHSSKSVISFNVDDAANGIPTTFCRHKAPSGSFGSLATFDQAYCHDPRVSFWFEKDGYGGYTLGVVRGNRGVGWMESFPPSTVETYQSPPGSGFTYETITLTDFCIRY